MPNWANGNCIVKGNPKDIENFCKSFIFEEEVDKKDSKKGQKYFARSFIHQTWKDFKKEFLGKSEIDFNVDFAWSCWSCLFDGYPNGKECVTLEWAMKKYNVEVEIETEEGGMGFEETITTQNEKPIYESKDMPIHSCQKCGCKQSIPSKFDLSNEECMECGVYGKWKDELQEIVKEKLEKIKERKK